MTPKLFQIFRTGTFTCSAGQTLTFNDADLQGMAASFDPRRRPAPLVLGHPQDDLPQHGKVTALLAKAGVLYAHALVGSTLINLVQSGRYGCVSASLIPPAAKHNPTPGAWYLKHVGFLGAMPPAVKGLEPPSFAEHEEAVCFSDTSATSAIISTRSHIALPPSGFTYDPARLTQHRLATEYRQVCPALSYAEAVALAEGVC